MKEYARNSQKLWVGVYFDLTLPIRRYTVFVFRDIVVNDFVLICLAFIQTNGGEHIRGTGECRNRFFLINR